MATTEADMPPPAGPHAAPSRPRPGRDRVQQRHEALRAATPAWTTSRSRCAAGSSSSSSGSTGSGKSTLMRLLIKELEPTAGHDPRRRPRPGRDPAQQGPLLPAQPRRRLPGLQAAAQPHRARQRRLRAAGHRRLAQGDPREGARHPAPHRPGHEAAPPTPTSSPAASSSASRWRARSSTTRRCCWPTSRPATSTPRRRSGSCSCSTAST